MNFELEVGWWDMQSNSSCNRVQSEVVHEFVQVVNSLTQLSELNLVLLVVIRDTLVRDQVNYLLINSQSMVSHATKYLLLLTACMSDPVETQLSSR